MKKTNLIERVYDRMSELNERHAHIHIGGASKKFGRQRLSRQDFEGKKPTRQEIEPRPEAK